MNKESNLEITVHELNKLIKKNYSLLLVDVRENWERATASIGGVHIPLGELSVEKLDYISKDIKFDMLVFYCHHGVRSLHVVNHFLTYGDNIKSLAGGIDKWSQLIDPEIPTY